MKQVVHISNPQDFFAHPLYELASVDYTEDTRNMAILYAGRIDVHAAVVSKSRWEEISSDEQLFIEDKWQKLVAASPNSRIFNGRTMALDKMEFMGISNEKLQVRADFICSDYKHYMATRGRDWEAYIKKYGTLPDDQLGVSAVVETIDGFILLGKRGRSCSINPGLWYVVGGGVDPNDVSQGAVNLTKALERELSEEWEGADWKLRNLNCVGISYDKQFPHPEIHFSAQTDLRKEDILHLYERGELLSDEFEGITFVKNDDLSLSHALFDRSEFPICGPGLTALLLFGNDRFGREWLAKNAFCIMGNIFVNP